MTEGMFATVRRRTVPTMGSLSQKTVWLMVLKRVQAASRTWRKLDGRNQLRKLLEGLKVVDGIADDDVADTSAP